MIIQGIILILFFILSFSYTQLNNWQDLKLHTLDGREISPAAPANIYLHEDDLRLFENIHKKRFLSLPWKGLVIGVATRNYPLDTKPATITNKKLSYVTFMRLNCEEKGYIAKQYNIDYIYSPKFDCNSFELKGVSAEGLNLYEVKS